jgi:signal transduction histidine kinase
VQVLVNLLENACKFTPKAGYIEIRGYPCFWERRHGGTLLASVERRIRTVREPNAYRVDVQDSGMPINPEFLEEIFEEYTTFSCNGDRSGGGLGLAICRMILTQHHGRVWAGNREGGPVFSVVLPTHPHVEPGGDTILSAHSKSELNHKNNHAAIN